MLLTISKHKFSFYILNIFRKDYLLYIYGDQKREAQYLKYYKS